MIFFFFFFYLSLIWLRDECLPLSQQQISGEIVLYDAPSGPVILGAHISVIPLPRPGLIARLASNF